MSVLFRKIARVRKVDCHRQVADDSSVKIAARILTLTCEVSDDQVQVFSAADDQPVGVDALPDPLRSVAEVLPDGSSGADVVAAIIDAVSTLSAPALDGIDITVANTEGMDVADTVSGAVAKPLGLLTCSGVATAKAQAQVAATLADIAV
jgi:hypothetical protein